MIVISPPKLKCWKILSLTCRLQTLPFWIPQIPDTSLPVKIDIIKHQSESDGKSTCPHAVVLAPENVTVYTFPCIPDYDKKKVVLVFPCKEAITLKELAATSRSICVSAPPKAASDTSINSSSTASALESCHDNKISLGKRQADGKNTEDTCPVEKRKCTVHHSFERAVFIDCTWNQTRNIIQDERLKDLRRVELRDHETQFWRCHEGLATSCLSTIEAVYYFMREYHEDVLEKTYCNEYDNLLFFFTYLYHTIRERQHGGKELKAYQRKRKDQ
ncbi:tRNA-uridine aminocarboxypropyltransferase 1-like isoform X2 [Babylonia areolata]|uniref:tRNA-uridine aminocarboxypropyltransferase 1-like isoform X2 n=1 Tax=Babylonia areolata TaxID=304850 RepID=UPI003FD6BC08